MQTLREAAALALRWAFMSPLERRYFETLARIERHKLQLRALGATDADVEAFDAYLRRGRLLTADAIAERVIDRMARGLPFELPAD